MTYDYLQIVSDKIQELKKQDKVLDAISDEMAEALMNKNTIYFFGTGHSHMIAEEVYTRAGGLASLQAILIPELLLHPVAGKSTMVERISGYAEVITSLYPFKKGDILFIISNSGRNAVPLELAQLANDKQMVTIAITSLKHASSVSARSGKLKLHELCNYTIDNLSEPGDAIIKFEDFNMGPISSITGSAIVNELQIRTTEKMMKRNHQPEVFKSSNLDSADEKNELYFKKYHHR